MFSLCMFVYVFIYTSVCMHVYRYIDMIYAFMLHVNEYIPYSYLLNCTSVKFLQSH